MPPTVFLRPVTDADMPVLELIRADPQEATRFGFYGFRTNNAMRRDYAEHGLLGEDGGVLAVIAGGELVGSVSWHRVRTAPISFTWNIGIGLLGSARGVRQSPDARSMSKRSRTLRSVSIAARYSSQSGCSPLSRR